MAVTPESLVVESHVLAALKADKGSDAILTSWSVENFTKPGDNYTCCVTSVKVKFSLHQQSSEVVYVVKINSSKLFKEFGELTQVLFQKEATFYVDILPELNASLSEIKEKPLKFPKCFYSSLETTKEIIFLEDLRAGGFKMVDCRRGLDVAHTSLILVELARLHASSRLLQDKTPEQDIPTRHPFILKDWLNYGEKSEESMVPMFHKYLETAVEILEKAGGYKTVISWIQTLAPELANIMNEQLGASKYSVVCHGDCWNNNILFRYSDDGLPAEVMLIDLQFNRWASPATDLNYLLYNSLTGEVRKANLETFLTTYYTAFSIIMEAAGKDAIFTQDQLLQEFRDKNPIGAIFAMMVIPYILFESKDKPDLSKEDNDFEAIMEEMKVVAIESLDSNPLMRPRFLALFDEMMETDLIPKM